MPVMASFPARYRAVMLDLHMLKKCRLLAVPATDSIFIIERDMHSKTAPPCTVRWYFDGEDLPFDDGCTILYLNSACHSDDTS